MRIPERSRLQALLAVTAAVAMLVVAAGCPWDKGEKTKTGGSSSGGGALGSGVVASVGDAQLTEGELKRLLPPDLGESVTGAEVREVIDRWVRAELLYQRARRDELEKTPEVAARLRDLERDLLADELLQLEFAKRVTVTDEELQVYYSKHIAEYTREVQLKQIIVNTREEADEILKQLRAGASFEQLARRSIDPTEAHGGDLGFLGKDAMNPAFGPYVFGVPPGSIVGPIASTFGFHVLKVAAQRPAADPISFEAARDEIMHGLLLQKQQAAQADVLQELRTASQVQVAGTYAGMSLEPAPEAPEQAPASFMPRGGSTAPAPAPAHTAEPAPAKSDTTQSGRD